MFSNQEQINNVFSDMSVFFVLTILSILVLSLDLISVNGDLGFGISKREKESVGWTDLREVDDMPGWAVFTLTGNIIAVLHAFITFALISFGKATRILIITMSLTYCVLNVVTLCVFYLNVKDGVPEADISLAGALYSQIITIVFSGFYTIWMLYKIIKLG